MGLRPSREEGYAGVPAAGRVSPVFRRRLRAVVQTRSFLAALAGG